MLNEPTVEEMIGKLSADGKPISRFELCSVATQRARQIIAIREESNGQSFDEKNALSVACREIADGKVVIDKN